MGETEAEFNEILSQVQSIEDAEELEDHLLAYIQSDRYNQKLYHLLLVGLDSQISKNWYSSDINLAIVKLIQFFPNEDDWDYLATLKKIMIKAMMNLPSPDFHSCLLMIPEPFQSMQEVNDMASLVRLLEESKFNQFWKTLASVEQEYSDLVPGFVNPIQEFMSDILASTFSNIQITDLCAFLNMNESEVKSKFGETSEKGFIELKKSKSNQPKPQEIEKISHIKLSQLAPLMSSIVK